MTTFSLFLAQIVAPVVQAAPDLMANYGSAGFFTALLATVAYFVRRDAQKDVEIKALNTAFLEKIEQLWKSQNETTAKYAVSLADLVTLRADLEKTKADLQSAHREIEDLRRALAAARA